MINTTDHAKITDYPVLNKNPFIEEMSESMKLNSRSKKVRARFSNSEDDSMPTDILKTITVDMQNFVKLFALGAEKIYSMRPLAVKVMIYMSVHLKKDSATINFDYKDCCKVLECNDKAIFASLAELMQYSVIARTQWKFVYSINPMVMFNGDRRSLVSGALRGIPDRNGHEVVHDQLKNTAELTELGKKAFETLCQIDPDFD